MQATEPRSKCLSVSKRNQDAWDIIDSYSMEWNVAYAQAIFRITREYRQMKKWTIYNQEVQALCTLQLEEN